MFVLLTPRLSPTTTLLVVQAPVPPDSKLSLKTTPKLSPVETPLVPVVMAQTPR